MVSKKVKRPKKEGNPYESAIVRELRKARRPLSLRSVATRSKMHWSTANKYTRELLKRRIIEEIKKGKRKKWKI